MVKSFIQVRGFGKALAIKVDLRTISLQANLLDSISLLLKAIETDIEMDGDSCQDEGSERLTQIRDQLKEVQEMKELAFSDANRRTKKGRKRSVRMPSIEGEDCDGADNVSMVVHVPESTKVDETGCPLQGVLSDFSTTKTGGRFKMSQLFSGVAGSLKLTRKTKVQPLEEANATTIIPHIMPALSTNNNESKSGGAPFVFGQSQLVSLNNRTPIAAAFRING